MPDRSAADSRLAEIVEALSSTDGVSVGSGRRRFGSDALKVDGRIFAMVTGGCLVFKLPRTRVEDLVERGDAVPFHASKGKPMKEWVAFEKIPDGARSIALAREALAFVSHGSAASG